MTCISGFNAKSCSGTGQMSRIQSDREIRARALLVSLVRTRIQTLLEVRAYRGDHMPARRHAEDADLVRIDMPLRGMEAHKIHCPLGIFQRRPTLAIRPRSYARHAILRQHARDASGCQPVTDFRAFKIDRQNVIAAAGTRRPPRPCWFSPANRRSLSVARLCQHRPTACRQRASSCHRRPQPSLTPRAPRLAARRESGRARSGFACDPAMAARRPAPALTPGSPAANGRKAKRAVPHSHRRSSGRYAVELRESAPLIKSHNIIGNSPAARASIVRRS